jgi:hypothetical protein
VAAVGHKPPVTDDGFQAAYDAGFQEIFDADLRI